MWRAPLTYTCITYAHTQIAYICMRCCPFALCVCTHVPAYTHAHTHTDIQSRNRERCAAFGARRRGGVAQTRAHAHEVVTRASRALACSSRLSRMASAFFAKVCVLVPVQTHRAADALGRTRPIFSRIRVCVSRCRSFCVCQCMCCVCVCAILCTHVCVFVRATGAKTSRKTLGAVRGVCQKRQWQCAVYSPCIECDLCMLLRARTRHV